MLACFISDIHGNEIAFEQCLELLKYLNPDEIFFLGDSVGYFPGGDAVLEKIGNSEILCQLGNHEKMLLEGPPAEKDHIYQLSFIRKKIGKTTLSKVKKWPSRREIRIGRKSFLLVHGSPSGELEDYVYPDNDFKQLTNQSYDVIIMGHTHYPFVKQVRGKLLVNAGSVGLPRDHGQMGSIAIYNSSTKQCKILRFQIDVKRVVDRYGPTIHESILSCLGRKPDSFIGEMIL